MTIKVPTKSLQQSAALVVAASLVPLFLFLIFQIGFSAREQRETTQARALAQSEAVILRADGEVRRLATVVDALATSGLLKAEDWPRFAIRQAELMALNPDIVRVEVRDGASVVQQLPEGGARSRIERFIEGNDAERARFVGYAVDRACRCLVFERATTTFSGRKLLVSIFARAATFQALLPPRERYEVSALVGPDGRFIARSLNPEARFGQPSSTYVRAAIASGKGQDIYKGRTLEGFENYSAFARSELTGWTAHLALGSQFLDRPAQRYFASLGLAALLSLLLAALLVGFAIRQMREARKVGERMQQAQKMEALGQLTGGLAHDFNNLLTPVIGVLDQLHRREGLDERGRRLAAGALSSAQRAARLTQQLLAFSRRQRLQIEPVDVGLLIEQVQDLVARTVGPKHHFEVEWNGDGRCVRSDATQLELALLNLAINARDASPDGGRITLRIEERGQEVWFALSDEGHGMDEQTRRRAFEPFFTTKPAGRGTGLGLAQVFGLAEQSGGTVEIESAPGAGTVVTLRLPTCDAAELAKVAAAARRVSAGPLRPLRLLVVDDEPEVRSLMVGILAEAGHAVDAVSNGASALAALAAEPFDLLISDYAMPAMNGAELIAKARTIRPDLPFLIVSGFADSEALERACLDTQRLRKPFTGEQLLAAVARSLNPSAG